MVMKHFCLGKAGCCIIAFVVLSLTLTGCIGGGGGSKSYTASGKVVDGNGDGIDGVKILVTGSKSATTTTKNGGEYALTGLTGICTLTPILEGYTFEPNNREISKANTNVEFTGTMKPIEPKVNTLTVENGTGGGDYAEGATVNISADAPEKSGKVFDKWTTSGGGSFADVNAESTSFTMPNNAVTVTATYRDATMVDYFEFDSTTGTITKYRIKGKYDNLDAEYDPEIPSSINGKAVTIIGKEAFQHAQITSVVIPNGVTTIEDWAFNNNLLVGVDIPESVTTIGNYAFCANKLTSMTIPDGITAIAQGAFWLNKLTSVTIPNSVTHIGNNAFLDNSLENITIPDSVTNIGADAFGINNLTTVKIPGSVLHIGNGAFGNNTSLASVEIPDNVSIDNCAFYQNSPRIATITIGSNVTLGDNLLCENNKFRNAYYEDGAGTYTYDIYAYDQDKEHWVKQ
jgi:uncharacterized repeat protein (TIGR02543 family)